MKNNLKVLLAIGLVSVLAGCANQAQVQAQTQWQKWVNAQQSAQTTFKNCSIPVKSKPQYADILAKLSPANDSGYSVSQLSNSSYPSAEQAELIAQYNDEMQKCRSEMRERFALEGFPGAINHLGLERLWLEYDVGTSKLLLKQSTYGEAVRESAESYQRFQSHVQMQQQQDAAQQAAYLANIQQQNEAKRRAMGQALMNSGAGQTKYVRCKSISDISGPILTFENMCPAGYFPQ